MVYGGNRKWFPCSLPFYRFASARRGDHSTVHYAPPPLGGKIMGRTTPSPLGPRSMVLIGETRCVAEIDPVTIERCGYDEETVVAAVNVGIMYVQTLWCMESMVEIV